MIFNSSSGYFEYNASFLDDQSTTWQVSCNDAVQDTLVLTDSFTISPPSCGNSVCELSDGYCLNDCTTSSNCGSYNNVCGSEYQ